MHIPSIFLQSFGGVGGFGSAQVGGLGGGVGGFGGAQFGGFEGGLESHPFTGGFSHSFFLPKLFPPPTWTDACPPPLPLAEARIEWPPLPLSLSQPGSA